MSNLIQEYPQRLREVEAQKALRNPEPEEQLLSREDAARFLKISLSSLDRHIRNKRLPFTRIGSRVFFLRSSLEQHLRDKQVLPAGFALSYDPQMQVSYTEVKKIEELSKRAMEVSRMLKALVAKDMKGGIDPSQNAEYEKMKKALLNELRYLSDELQKLEEIQVKRFRERFNIPEPESKQ